MTKLFRKIKIKNTSNMTNKSKGRTGLPPECPQGLYMSVSILQTAVSYLAQASSQTSPLAGSEMKVSTTW
jgi:hypothetical protein